MKIIDIGCGRKKFPGSIGIDFSDFADVDIKLDLNISKLPFDDDSVDFVYTSHCLEHLSLEGFLNMVHEMYRVCKTSGTIFIAVPYFQNTVSLANPFHNNQVCFNEHTFRFFSSDPSCPPALTPQDYQSPSCPQWGLRYSANDEIGIELSLQRIEYSYFSQYTYLDPEEKRLLRNSNLNVVDSICYWLRPIKPAPRFFDETPIEDKKPQDMVEFVLGQVSFVENQISWLKDHQESSFSELLLKKSLRGKRVEDFLAELNDLKPVLAHPDFALFELEGVLCPYHEVARVLDLKIQLLRQCIDDIVNNSDN